MKHAIWLIAIVACGCASANDNPDLAWARGVRPFVHDLAVARQQRRFREAGDRQWEAQSNAVEERKIPYTELMSYPSNWPAIVTLRDR
jgi:hypothetical protein